MYSFFSTRRILFNVILIVESSRLHPVYYLHVLVTTSRARGTRYCYTSYIIVVVSIKRIQLS
jgi:hypothetical protein